MNKQLIIILWLLFGSVSVFSQTVPIVDQLLQYSAPVKWELYRVSPKNVSVIFPKMPVLISKVDDCSELNISEYSVYADEIVYGLNIYSKSDKKLPEYCQEKIFFNKQSFKLRINELETGLKTKKLPEVKINKRKAEFIKDELYNYWLIDDLQNNRWFELWTANSAENVEAVQRFINSLEIGGKNEGIEIKNGADSTLGDLMIKEEEKVLTEIPKSKTENKGPRFIKKPQPKYTDMARKNNVSGIVVLRVTFLSNGGVGSISTVRGLEYGLTEQAIIAAKKVVFIPAKRNGKNQSATMSIQYTFTIY